MDHQRSESVVAEGVYEVGVKAVGVDEVSVSALGVDEVGVTAVGVIEVDKDGKCVVEECVMRTVWGRTGLIRRVWLRRTW